MRSIATGLRRTAVRACILILFLPVAAHAYVDPTAGSVLFQAIVAGALAGAFTIRLWWTGLMNSARGLWMRLTRR